MKRLIVLLGVAGVSLSAVFVRWSTAPSLILALYRMAFSAALMAVPVLAGRRRELKSLTRRDVLLCLASGLFLLRVLSRYSAVPFLIVWPLCNPWR